MSRLARNGLGTSFFHVMSQGINKEYIFENDNLKKKYVALMRKNLDETNVEVVSYCVMSNHVHIVMHTESIDQMSKYMKLTNTEFAQFYNWYNDRVGFVFRDRFKSQPIYDEKHLFQCINYVHLNPVKAKIVSDCSKYKYSSYNDFVNNKFLKDTKFLRKFFSDKSFIDISRTEQCSDFLDVDYDKSIVMDEYINNYKRNVGLDLNTILEDDELSSELIKVLLKSSYINKKDVQKKLNISFWKLNHMIGE